MKRKFVAFDIETAAVLPEAQFQDWRRHRPLGNHVHRGFGRATPAAPILWDSRQSEGGAPGRDGQDPKWPTSSTIWPKW